MYLEVPAQVIPSPSLCAPSPSQGGMVAQAGESLRITDHVGTFGGSLRGEETADWVPHVQKEAGLFVVGTGKIKNDRCGRSRPLRDDVAGACQNEPENHPPFLLSIGCMRWACPEDWPRAARKEGRRAENKLNGFLTEKFKHQAALLPGFVPRYRPDHISVHPPRDVVVDLVRRTEKALKKKCVLKSDKQYGAEFHKIFQKKYNEAEQAVLLKAGLRDYLSVPHSIRLRKARDADQADVDQDTQRYRRVLDTKTWMKGVKFSPHSHIATDGSFLMGYAEFYTITGGWTYRRHGEVTSIKDLIYYLMSHATAVPGRHSLRYLGALHNMNLQGLVKVEYFPSCPVCLREGKHDPHQCNYTVGQLSATRYEKDPQGHQVLVDWEWGPISQSFIRRTRTVPVFTLTPPGEPRRVMRKIPQEKPERYGMDEWNIVYTSLPLPMCGPWSTRKKKKPREKIDLVPKEDWDKLPRAQQLTTRYIQRYSVEEYQDLPDHEKPQQWV